MEKTHSEMKLSKFKRVCVFCGSSLAIRQSTKILPLNLAMNCWVARNIDLVYGRGSIGLMGLLSLIAESFPRHSWLERYLTGETVGEVKATTKKQSYCKELFATEYALQRICNGPDIATQNPLQTVAKIWRPPKTKGAKLLQRIIRCNLQHIVATD
ncbi:hypothetical protein OROGR_005443 [Orobanche gracilis]